MLKNEPKKYIGDKEVDELRAQYENRGLWYYQVIEEALANGLDLDFARQAIFNAGVWSGKHDFSGIRDTKTFAKEFMSEGVIKANEGELVELTDDKIIIDIGYCPLIKAWQEFTDDEEKIAELCDIAMCVDRGILSTYGWELKLEGTIGGGDEKCRLCILKNKEG